MPPDPVTVVRSGSNPDTFSSLRASAVLRLLRELQSHQSSTVSASASTFLHDTIVAQICDSSMIVQRHLFPPWLSPSLDLKSPRSHPSYATTYDVAINDHHHRLYPSSLFFSRNRSSTIRPHSPPSQSTVSLRHSPYRSSIQICLSQPTTSFIRSVNTAAPLAPPSATATPLVLCPFDLRSLLENDDRLIFIYHHHVSSSIAAHCVLVRPVPPMILPSFSWPIFDLGLIRPSQTLPSPKSLGPIPTAQLQNMAHQSPELFLLTAAPEKISRRKLKPCI